MSCAELQAHQACVLFAGAGLAGRHFSHTCFHLAMLLPTSLPQPMQGAGAGVGGEGPELAPELRPDQLELTREEDAPVIRISWDGWSCGLCHVMHGEGCGNM